ncbi:MAG TPA: T9SS type A sorting domain-containing protein, partial [Paludibacteraceae bacterium]|nr:T9SS type A sorting domain-containing protein [Paludibacteraceae bacterium]
EAMDDIKPLLTMDVIGQNSSDRVYLITAEGTTKGYDPGWDGTKSLSTDMVQIFALDADNRRMQVNTDNDLNDTYIGFRTGGESMYSLRFKFNNEMQGLYQSLYVQDLATGTTQEITDGTTMSFASTAGTAEKRFRILAARIITGSGTIEGKETISVMTSSSAIRVNNNTNDEVSLKVFNLAGQLLLLDKAAVGVQTINHHLTKGTYIIEAKSVHSGSRTTVKAIIH